MADWKEFRLYISPDATRPGWPAENYRFIRSHLLPLVEQHRVEQVLILNYYDEGRQDYIRFRVLGVPATLAGIEASLNDLKAEHIIHDYVRSDWDPAKDATDRLEAVRAKLEQMCQQVLDQNWEVSGRSTSAEWVLSKSDYQAKHHNFETIVAKVVGRCAKTFMEELEYRPNDRWLMSLFVHLLLNSLCFGKAEEEQIRAFPYL